MKLVLSIPLLVTVLLLHADATPSLDAAGFSISGTVWDDQNADGIRQSSEPGTTFAPLELGKWIDGRVVFNGPGGLPLFRDANGRSVRVDEQGNYSFANLEPGAYVVRIARGAAGNPHLLTYPIRRGAGEFGIGVTLENGSASGLDFGLHVPREVPRFKGIAWINAEPVPTPDVRAFIDGIDCTGPGGLLTPHEHPGTFLVSALSAALMPGCGTEGKTIRFTINGQAANESAVWRATAREGLGGPGFDLTVGPPFAYFGPSVIDADGFFDLNASYVFDALVDGRVCATVHFRTPGWNFPTVPSTELRPGCGYEGAVVTFFLNGQPVGGPVAWKPGYYEGPEVVLPAPVRSPAIRPPAAGNAGLAVDRD